MNKTYSFVYVVCGDEFYLEQLRFSYKKLRANTDLPIFIVTDLARNNSKLEFENVINIKTPLNYNNHQASIYLKTSLNKFLPKNRTYCYLDTDVIAINRHIENIFLSYNTPIIFAKDICTIDEFSPFSIHCNCINKRNEEEELLEKLIQRSRQLKKSHIDNVTQTTQFNKSTVLKKIKTIFRYYFENRHFYKISEDYTLNKKTKDIFGPNNQSIYKPDIFQGNEYNFEFVNKKSLKLKHQACKHLRKEIKLKFKIDIQSTNFNHWNGGVFLFNENSSNFFYSWHNKSMEIFKDKNWVNRDQGVLIASIFEHKLENSPTLDSNFNFIVSEDLILNNEIDFDREKIAFLHFINGYNQNNVYWNFVNRND